MWHQMNKFGTAVLSGLLAASASGQCVPAETLKLTASDAAAEDYFGFLVGISGTTAIVGAVWDDDKGSQSGSAYLFDTTTREQLFKLTASDGAAGDWFGYVDIDGTTAIVGAPYHSHGGLAESGSAYVYDTTTGQELFELVPSDLDAGDRLGGHVSVSGAIAIVGAYHGDDAGPNSGAAYLFDTTTGRQLFKLTAADGATRDWFGQGVAISGTTVVVGAPQDDDNGDDSGSAYVFDATTGAQLFKLIPTDGTAGDLFGGYAIDVADGGGTAIIGAYNDNDAGNGAGSAYLFDTTTGQQLFKLMADDASAGDNFGCSVAISGTTAIVGAWADDHDSGVGAGSLYVFDITTGEQLHKLTASDAAPGDAFGVWADVSGTTAIVGSFRDDDGAIDAGSAYVFDLCASCPADFDGDGVVDTRDVLAFLNAWTAGDSSADFDSNGVIDTRDVLAFLNAWTAGC